MFLVQLLIFCDNIIPQVAKFLMVVEYDIGVEVAVVGSC
jgi:hypothetical protein